MTTARTSELDTLLSRLAKLYKKAGSPTFREMSRRIEGVHHTTIADFMSGRTVPQWQKVLPVITYLGGEPAEFREDWRRAKAAQVEKARRQREDSQWRLVCAVCICEGAQPQTATTIMDGDAVCPGHANTRRKARLQATTAAEPALKAGQS